MLGNVGDIVVIKLLFCLSCFFYNIHNLYVITAEVSVLNTLCFNIAWPRYNFPTILVQNFGKRWNASVLRDNVSTVKPLCQALCATCSVEIGN